jgi:hypothetical protein
MLTRQKVRALDVLPNALRSLLLMVALGLTGVLPVPAGARETCTPDFPLKDGWWGADAAYSIPLPDGRSVWMFGDTLYGDRRLVVGKDPRMVRNSIGISSCDDDGKWKIAYVMRKGSDGNPVDFFQARTKDTWYWALDGFLYKNDLWVTLLCIRPAPSTSEGLGFEVCGADLARVSDLARDPQQWKAEYLPLVPDGTGAYPSATAVVEGDYVYIFALYEKDSRPMVLTRIPLKGLDTPAKNLEYLSKDGAWKPGLKPEDAKAVMKRGASEMTVRYHPGLNTWLAVLNSPRMFSDKILLRTAPGLSGPWSDGQVVYRIPEMQKNSAGYDRDTFCYAAKEHPEFRQPGSILITYACNTMKVNKLTTRLDLYFPKVVRIKLPASVSEPASSSK